MLLSAGLLVVGAVPAFMALSTGSLGITLATAVILSAVFVTYQGSALPAMTELFPTARRYSGFSVGYNLSIALFGGTAPYLSTFLIDVTGASIAPGFLLAGAAVLSILTALSVKETAPTPLERRSNRIRVASRQPELDPLAKREGMMGNPAGELR